MPQINREVPSMSGSFAEPGLSRNIQPFKANRYEKTARQRHKSNPDHMFVDAKPYWRGNNLKDMLVEQGVPTKMAQPTRYQNITAVQLNALDSDRSKVVGHALRKNQHFNSRKPFPPSPSIGASTLNTMNVPLVWVNDESLHWNKFNSQLQQQSLND